jgi:hypothetical protein
MLFLSIYSDFPQGRSNETGIDEGKRSISEPAMKVGNHAVVINHGQRFDRYGGHTEGCRWWKKRSRFVATAIE